MANKVNVKIDRFVDWYFSDSDDKQIFANNLIEELKAGEKVVTTVQGLLDMCCEIPNYITELDGIEEYEDKVYDPEEISLIP